MTSYEIAKVVYGDRYDGGPTFIETSISQRVRVLRRAFRLTETPIEIRANPSFGYQMVTIGQMETNQKGVSDGKHGKQTEDDRPVS